MKHQKNTEKQVENPYVRRFIAFLIDWYLSSLFAMIPVIVFQSINGKDLILINRIDTLTKPQAIISTVLSLSLYSLYFCVFPLLKKNNFASGQTIGRRILGITVIKIDGSELTFSNLFVRDFVCFLLLQGNLTSVYIYILSLVEIFTGSVAFVPYVQLVYYAVIIISMLLLFTRRKQTIHDLLSHTKMVKVYEEYKTQALPEKNKESI